MRLLTGCGICKGFWHSIVLVFACTALSAQPTGIVDSLLKKFDRYRVNHLQEKIYAHVDQDLLLTGEMLWFKLYVVDGALQKPLDISKVAYVEVLDKANRPILQTKIALNEGTGSGSLFLPASISSGNYTFRAYTNWMKNFGPDFFYHKSITIINPFRKLDRDEPDAKAKPDAQLFPEGGSLVYGLKSKVGFRVTNTSGKGIAFDGVVVDQKNDTIAAFKPLKFGMGNFEFTPIAGNEYRAIIRDLERRQFEYPIPVILSEGYVLRVADSTENLVSVSLRTNLSGHASTPVYVFIHARNIVSMASVRYLNAGRADVLIPKKDFQDGISHITCFDADLQPICERLYFMPPREKLNIDIEANQASFGLRRKVSIDLSATRADGSPQHANLSVAVFRVDSLQAPSQSDILSYLWLGSDLSGTIESPSYYMDNTPEVIKAIDNLMLTHGWRRFKWNEILTNQNTGLVQVPEYRGHIIQGKITSPSGTPVNAARTFLSSPSRNIQIYGSLSNQTGNVKFEMKDFWGPRKIIAQLNTQNDSTSHIEIFSPFADTFSARPIPPFYFSQDLEEQLRRRSFGMQVEDVFYQERTNKFKTPADDSTAFYGKADATYLLDDYTRFPVMEEVMREYVPGVMVRRRKGGFRFMTLDNVNKGVFDEDPMILLDGIPLFDVDKIMAFDPLLVKKLEILNRRYYMGVLSMPGIVSYTTYTGDLAGFQLDPRTVMLDYEGLQPQREFYVPKYEDTKQRESRLPDQRSLLHWAPRVITGDDGHQRVDFFTSDQPGTYKIVVEGLTNGGISGSSKGTFVVRAHAD